MLSVVHNYYYLLALLIIHSLRTSICVCKYLYFPPLSMTEGGGGANDPAFSVDLTRFRAIFRDPEILYRDPLPLREIQILIHPDPDSSFPYGPVAKAIGEHHPINVAQDRTWDLAVSR